MDHTEGWELKNWCFQTVVLEKTLESPLDWKEIKPVNPKGNQSWIFIGRIDGEAETPIFWPPDAKNWILEKTLMLWKTKGTRWRGWQRMRWLDGITNSMDMSLSKLWGVVDGQGSLACYSPWGRKDSDMNEQLNWTENKNGWKIIIQDTWCGMLIAKWPSILCYSLYPYSWIFDFAISPFKR